MTVPSFRKALGDGKRSIILKPSWPKVSCIYFVNLTFTVASLKTLTAQSYTGLHSSNSTEIY